MCGVLQQRHDIIIDTVYGLQGQNRDSIMRLHMLHVIPRSPRCMDHAAVLLPEDLLSQLYTTSISVIAILRYSHLTPRYFDSSDLTPTIMNATDIIIEDKSLPPSQTAQYIVEACDAAVAAASEGKTISETDDTPGLEDFLWTLWSNLLNQAQNSEEDHYRLVEIVGCLKRTKQQSSNWRIWGGETSWSELPLFGPVTRENLNGTFTNMYEIPKTHL
jgi:hypothetical protein